MDLARHRMETIQIMTKKDDKTDQPSGGETTWTNTGATRYGRGHHTTGSFGDDMLRPSPNHGTQRLPNDDDDEWLLHIIMKHAWSGNRSLASGMSSGRANHYATRNIYSTYASLHLFRSTVCHPCWSYSRTPVS